MPDRDAPDPADAPLPWATPLPAHGAKARRERGFDLSPDAGARARIAADLGLIDLPALRFTGRILPQGRDDLVLEGRLTAQAVQPCSVTLTPVPASVDEAVRRLYLAEMPDPAGDEVEIPEDTDAEPLGPTIDPAAVAVEALALALPLYPRAPGADLAPLAAAPPGAARLDDAAPRPFAGLAALRDRLKKGEGEAG
ncbi:MAG TPA: YceD family protein [Paracoccaceae bacterium]|nr:YceD family protein [Paracoccaceae bacterium]HMO73340.1 YceD family protein [Paracoccaceae bacterium]